MELPTKLKELQEKIIAGFSLCEVKAKKGYAATYGVGFERGDIGGVLDEACLELLPNGGGQRFRDIMAEKGVVLVHFNGFIMTIPPEHLCKYKIPPRDDQLILC